jgi:hypothetical protein
MNKTHLTILAIVIILIATSIYFYYPHKETTYLVDGEQVTLQYFGNKATYDFDGDGRLDTVAIFTQNTGGSGTFYYVAATLNTAQGYVGSQAFFLGDRIAPQTTEISQSPAAPGVVIVNFADRKPSESFVTPPSVGKTVWLKFDIKAMKFEETMVR